MVGYETVEAAVLQRIRTHFADELNEPRCKAADIDSVFLAMQEEDADYGCVIDYGDGRRRTRPPFASDMWGWDIIGFILIRFRGDVGEHDRKARLAIDKLTTLFEDDKRLGNLVPLAQVEQISRPEPERINEVPMYWIAFNIVVIDK